MQAARRQQAGAEGLFGRGDRTGGARPQGDQRVLAEADGDAPVVRPGGARGAALDGGVELLAQPGGEVLNGLGEDLGGDGRKEHGVHIGAQLGIGVRLGTQRGSPRRRSPTQRARASGLRAATGMPAATSCRATGTEYRGAPASSSAAQPSR